eukprot:scaffold1295_cov220-Pinguiococcus_pyrenoidosus.AAC.18
MDNVSSSPNAQNLFPQPSSTAFCARLAPLPSILLILRTKMLAPAQAHDAFFCSVLELVPRDLLLNRLEAVADPSARFQKHKKQNKQSAQQKKAEARKLKRKRFDLALSENVSEAQARREEEERQEAEARLQEANSEEAQEKAEQQEAELKQFLESEAELPKQRVSSIVELQQRLHERIRQQQQQREGKGKTKKRKAERKAEKQPSTRQAKAVRDKKAPEGKDPEQARTKETSAAEDKSVPEIDFGDIIVPDEKDRAKFQTKQRGSKIGELRKQLVEAEAKERRLAELRTTDDGALAAEQQKWEDAINDSRGKRVKDNRKLLRKALKARERKKGKSKEAWEGRLKAQQKAQQDKQETRRENLRKRKSGDRADGGPKAKRAKRRPGFEGKKSEFLNKNKNKNKNKT